MKKVVKYLLLEGVMEVPQQATHTPGMVRALGNRKAVGILEQCEQLDRGRECRARQSSLRNLRHS